MNVELKEFFGKQIFCRPSTPDEIVAKSCFGGEFSIFLEFLRQIKREFAVIDLGGYIGSAAIEFASLPNSKVISLEPSPDNFRMLLLNALFYKNITPIWAAIGSCEGNANIYARHTGAWGHTLIENPKDCQETSLLANVNILTMQSVINKHIGADVPLAAVKIDIEGGEVEILSNVNLFSKIPIICIELHDRIVDGCSSAWYNFLKANPNRISINCGGEKHLSIDPVLLTLLCKGR